MVLRAFRRRFGARVADDPLDSLETLELELVLADVASLEHQAVKRRKQARVKGDNSMAAEADAIDAALVDLQAGMPLYRAGMPPDQRGHLRDSFLLTDKRVLAVVNLGEDQLVDLAARSLGRVPPRVGRGGPRGLRPARGRGGSPFRSTSAASSWRGSGWRGVVPRVARARLDAARAPDVLHHRGQGVEGVDVPRRGAGARVRGRSIRTCRAGSSGGRSSTRTSWSSSEDGRRPRRRGGSGSRARTTRCSMGMCWRSASTSED